MTERRQMIVTPMASTNPEIGRWLWMIENARERTNWFVDRIDQGSLDWQPAWSLHSIGTLLYHIAFIEMDWLHVEVLGNDGNSPYIDGMDSLFPYPVRTDNQLTRIVGVPLSEHRERLATVRRKLVEVYSTMSLDDFRRARAVAEGDVTPEWVLQYLCQHEAEHRSEIAALQTQFKLVSDEF